MSVTTLDFLLATRDKRVVDHKKVINETSKQTYFCLSKIMKSAEKKFKGGKKLKDFVVGNETSSGGYYSPHNAFGVQIKDGLHPISAPWAYHYRQYATVNEESDLNDGDIDAFVDMIRVQEGGCIVNAANDWETALFALPYKERMEDDASQEEAQRPYSLLSLITRDGLAPSSSNGGLAAGSTAWTTVQSVDPLAQTWWRNQAAAYSASDPAALDGGIISSFDTMMEKVEFESPDMISQYVDSPERQQKAILTSSDGITTYKKALRMVNDRMAALSDPSIRGPQFEGVPMKKVAQLDSLGWIIGNPDYLWVDFSCIVPFFHSGHFFSEMVVPGGVEHANKTVVYKFTWYNMLMRSRRRQGRVSAA